MAAFNTDERNRSLKEALLDSLTASMSPQKDIRAAGEEQIKALEVTEEFGVHLAELTVDAHAPLALRQLACLLLKQYVECHWSQMSEKYRIPETSPAAKAAIRNVIPIGLGESISKVRSSVAYAISAIAHWDWPEEWPELFTILMNALTQGNPNAVHGAMRVLTEFSTEITDTQMPQVAPVILPEMYKIFANSEGYSIRTRARAVGIFNTFADLIAPMSELNRNVAKQLLFPILPQFTEAFVKALEIPDGDTSDNGLKMEILKALTNLVKNFPKRMSQWIPQILPWVWHCLTQSADVYVRTCVNDTDARDDPVDSDGEVLGFNNFVIAIFDFVHVLIEVNKFRHLVKKNMDDIVYYAMLYMQLTEEQMRTWELNPDQFVEDEDDDTFSYSVRICAQDLLLTLASDFPTIAVVAICKSVQRYLQEADGLKNAGNQHWWKLHEICMLTLGCLRQLILDTAATGKIEFNIVTFLQNFVMPDMNADVSPFLLGRALWMTSRFASSLTAELLQQFLQVNVNGLHPERPACVRISAIRAAFGFFDHLKQSNNTQLLAPFLGNITDGLVSIAQQFSADVNILALSLETLSIVISVDKAFTAANEVKIAPLAIAVLLKYSSDALIVSLVEDIFKVLSSNEACVQTLHQRLLPTLVSILTASPDKAVTGLQAVALDVLETLVRSSPHPLTPVMIEQVFPAACHCVLTTDDNSAMQNGGECLRAYVSVSLDQVIQWQDDAGHNGLYYVIQVVNRLLDPKTSDDTAAFVGRLVSILISKVGTNLGEDLDLMLRAVLSKLQQAETPTVIQSLVLVFAHLMHTQMEAVLNFLTNVPDPTGRPALEFVLNEWCSKQHLFYGSYEQKVSTVALGKLLEHTINTNDSRMQGIDVNGDPIVCGVEGIRTRSKSATSPQEWTKIPLLVKMYKLLIHELSNQLENTFTNQPAGDDDEVDEDDADDDWEDEDGAEDGECSLESLLRQYAEAAGYEYDDDDNGEDDPDALQDPISEVDLQAYLTKFLKALSSQPCYEIFAAYHNDSEKKVLQTIGIQVV
ncbi:importin-9-like [Tubulanus polymorphus]|uniref:importin-9-like n=1 Tax=Tubulanus polymorphus TaxID=672921 RepID=UPI003DA1F41B